MRERIYIAGPYAPKDCTLHDAARLAQKNVDAAIEVANQLIEKGHYIFCPHLSHYIHIHASCKKDYGQNWWYDEDLTFLHSWATALYYIASSYGADLELKTAETQRLKIYRNMDEVPNV